MRVIKLIRTFFLGSLLIAAAMPLSASAALYYNYYPTDYNPVYYYGAPGTVTYPYARQNVVVYPSTTTSTYWYGGAQPNYYYYNYGAKPCFYSGNTLVCW